MWIREIQVLTPQLSCDLAMVLEACLQFLKDHAEEFDDGPGGLRNSVIIGIEEDIENLQCLQRDFERMTMIPRVYASNVYFPLSRPARQ